MKRRILTVMMAYSLTVTFGVGAVNAETTVHYYNLDDSLENPRSPENRGRTFKIGPDPGDGGVAQQFTVGKVGNVSAVTLGLAQIGSPGGKLIVSIWTVDDTTGYPGERIGSLAEIEMNSLSRIPWPPPDTIGFVTVEGSVTGLTPGEDYFLVIDHDDQAKITRDDGWVAEAVQTPKDAEPVAVFWGGRWQRIWTETHSFGSMYLYAHIEGSAPPSPADGTTDVSREVVLAWPPDDQDVAHDVYLGTSREDVEAASQDNPRGVLVSRGHTETEFVPGRLELGQTYYWRVDKLSGGPTTSVTPGDVWHFEVEPFAYPITGIMATASGTLGADATPDKTIDGSGLTHNGHGVQAVDMWISDTMPAWIQYEFDRSYKLHELWIWNGNQLVEPFVGFGAKDVDIEHSLDGTHWTPLEDAHVLSQAPGTEVYVTDSVVDFGGTMAQFVRITINSVHGLSSQASLSEVRFHYEPVFARKPQPADGTVIGSLDAVLSWRPGRKADLHDVYWGDSSDSVLDESASRLTTSEPSFELSDQDLTYGTTYYWKVNEVNETESPPVHAGDLWHFQVPEYVSVDDMESYRDEAFLEIWAHWADGEADPENGAIVGNGNDAETDLVFEGEQALPMSYDNSTAAISEATRTFDPPLDWVRGAPAVLSIFFQGDPTEVRNRLVNDAAPLYLVLADSAGHSVTVDYPDPAATHISTWTEWVIPMSDLATLDLSSVRSLTLGVGGDGSQGKGKMFFDNIRVGIPAPQMP